ncbi:MAG: N-acetylmuramoyl-L-alanine amidase [Tissierellia bacterium]|nr:N-acetylmuramoyl-L-alanine amidase [Tissierellia bacterium]
MKNRDGVYIIRFNKKILLGLLALIIFFTGLKMYFRTSKIFNPENLINIVLDPGHGGIDGGTGNVNDILEKEINLDVCLKLKKELLVEGYNIIMTREKDQSLEELSNINASRYRRDLDARKTIINENQPLAFVSIHVNASTKTSARGVKIYHFPDSTEGKRLAENIKESVDEYLYKNYLKEDNLEAEVLTENYYILRETKYPGVLIEIGFITNPEENKLMKSKKYKEKIAYAIKKGIVSFSGK